MEFARGSTEREVPDPYNGESQDFDWVLDLLEAAMDGLLEHLRVQLETRP